MQGLQVKDLKKYTNLFFLPTSNNQKNLKKDKQKKLNKLVLNMMQELKKKCKAKYF